VTSGGGISCADQIDRVSDPERPLRAAQFLKPPALPGDTYLPDHKALAGLRRFFVLGPKARRYRFMEFASNLMWGTTRHKSRPCRTAKSGSSPSLSTGMPKGWDDTSPRLAIATPPLRPSAWQSRPRFGAAAGVARGVALRHDHGSQFLADHFQNQIKFWGMAPSFAFVSKPETNGGGPNASSEPSRSRSSMAASTRLSLTFEPPCGCSSSATMPSGSLSGSKPA
jgi:hypothetical protein